MSTNIDWSKVTSLVATEHGAMVNKEAVSGPPLPPGQTVEGGQYLGDISWDPWSFGTEDGNWTFLFNVVDSNGKLLLVDKLTQFFKSSWFDLSTGGSGVPPYEVMRAHARILWNKHFYLATDGGKARVCAQTVAHPKFIAAGPGQEPHTQIFPAECWDGKKWNFFANYTMQINVQTNCPAGTVYDPNKKQCMGCGAGYEYNIPMGQCVPIKKMSKPGRSYSPYSNQPAMAWLRGIEDRVDWSKVTSLVAVDDGVLVNKEAVASLEGLGQSVIEYQFRFPGRVFIPRRAAWTPIEPRVGLYIGGRYVGDVLQSAAEWLKNLEIAHLAHAPGSMPQISWTPAYSAPVPVPAPFYATPFYQVF